MLDVCWILLTGMIRYDILRRLESFWLDLLDLFASLSAGRIAADVVRDTESSESAHWRVLRMQSGAKVNETKRDKLGQVRTSEDKLGQVAVEGEHQPGTTTMGFEEGGTTTRAQPLMNHSLKFEICWKHKVCNATRTAAGWAEASHKAGGGPCQGQLKASRCVAQWHTVTHTRWHAHGPGTASYSWAL